MSGREGGEADRIAAYYREREEKLPAELYAEDRPAPRFIRARLDEVMEEMLGAAGLLPLTGRRVLDVGCGQGQWLGLLRRLGAEPERLAGLDLLEDRVARARERLPGADLRAGDAADLPWRDGSFDLVLQSMMITSILDSGVRAAVAREMARVVTDDGVVVSYDFHVGNPRNPATRALGRRELRSLFPGFEMEWRSVTLAPPLIRLLAPRMPGAAAALERARIFNTHSMALLRRP